MNSRMEAVSKASVAAKSVASPSEIIDALNAMTLDDEASTALAFAEYFPAIVAANNRGLSTPAILKMLERMGVHMHHATYNKLFKAELKARNDRGERFCCATCGAALKPQGRRDMPEGASPPVVNEVTGGAA